MFLFSLFFWCPCLAINVSAQYNGGLLPDNILLTQWYYHRGTRLNAIKRFCICSLWSHLNVLTFLPLTGGCSEGLGAFGFFFKQQNSPKKEAFSSKVGIVPSSSSEGSRKTKKCVLDWTVRKQRSELHCPVACADKKSRGARAPG